MARQWNATATDHNMAPCRHLHGAHVCHCCYVLLRVLLHLIQKNWNDFLSENRYQLTDLCTFPYPHQIHRYSQHQYCTDSTDNSIVNRQRTFCNHRDMCNLMGWFLSLKHKIEIRKYMTNIMRVISDFLGPGKDPGSSLEHSSTHNIIEQYYNNTLSISKKNAPSRRTFSQAT